MITMPAYSVHKEHTVSENEYREFCKKYEVWCILTDTTLGQAFCDYFKIEDSLLCDLIDTQFIHWRITDCWLKK